MGKIVKTKEEKKSYNREWRKSNPNYSKEYHSKPLNVVLCCRECHERIHRKYQYG